MILYKQKGKLLVHYRRIWILFVRKLIQNTKHKLHQTESHNLRTLPNSSFYARHYWINL